MHTAANTRLATENGVSIEEMKERRYARVAVRSAGSPEDVVDAVVYLARPNSAYITGINLPVSGGVPFGI
jgi:NAD(P)-dependent dehydrogenase (short-subunit alcohol dehydrogenase family)